MKNVYQTIVFCCISFFAAAQSQRTILVEEFTSATCPPSGVQDPLLDTLLANNTAKVVSIMYQGPPWPSSDPMYNQNPADVNTRSTYYSVPYVPYSRIDGKVPGPSTPNLIDITQGLIDSIYTLPSPFTISVNTAFNSAADSMIVDVTITCTQAVTISQPRLQVAIVEDIVHFPSPIAGSGLQSFYTVMRKMLPDANGTSLSGVWTNGQTQSFHFIKSINFLIYNLSELSVVAFIQDDSSKEVYQAGYAPSLPAYEDAGISLISSVPPESCDNSFSPVLTFKNYGTNTLTFSEIHYSTDGQAPQTIIWTGSLASGETDTLLLPAQTANNSVSHIFTAYSVNANGHGDYNSSNNSNNVHFIMASPAPGISSINEDFQLAGFPYSDWSLYNPDNDRTWNRHVGVGGFSATGTSLKLEFYNIEIDAADYLYFPAVDLMAAQAPLNFIFDIAYRQYLNEQDSLNVQVSSDCGVTWNTLYAKAGATLATTAPGTPVFYPTASQWRKDTVNFNTLIGQPNVLIRLEGISRMGNNLYLDNINFDGENAVRIIESDLQNEVSVYPNPSNGSFTVLSTKTKIESIVIYNSTGKLVYNGTAQPVILNESPGIYLIQITDENKHVIHKKIILQ